MTGCRPAPAGEPGAHRGRREKWRLGAGLRLALDSAKWEEGYRDGAARKPGKAGQPHSYYSGWIEGDARRGLALRLKG